MLQSPPHHRRAEVASLARASPFALALLATCVALSLLSCGTSIRQVRPPADLPDSFSRSGTRPLPERWWLELEDAALDELVEKALSGNFDLQTVWDRLAQAEAVARREGAALVPAVDAQAGVTRTQLTQSAARGSGTGGRNNFTLGLSTSYELDLWGRIRSARDAARLDARATESELRAAAITLSAEVAKTWYELVEQRRQMDIIDDQLQANQQVLELVTLRFRKGQVGAADVLRQRQLVESTRGDRSLVEARAQVLAHQLAVLIGRAPGASTLPPRRDLVSLPPLPETGIPADVILRRPDVRQAYLAVSAADRRLAAALADRYPALALSGSAAFSAQELRDLFDNWIATITANLVAPVIDGGRRAAEADRTRAVLSQRLHEYGRAILVSLREVEDALVQEQKQRLLLDSLSDQLEISGAVVERIRDQYVHGTIDYLDVLQALLNRQALERSHASAQRQLVEYRLDLYRALGGGWAMRRPDLASMDTEDSAR